MAEIYSPRHYSEIYYPPHYRAGSTDPETHCNARCRTSMLQAIPSQCNVTAITIQNFHPFSPAQLILSTLQSTDVQTWWQRKGRHCSCTLLCKTVPLWCSLCKAGGRPAEGCKVRSPSNFREILSSNCSCALCALSPTTKQKSPSSHHHHHRHQ